MIRTFRGAVFAGTMAVLAAGGAPAGAETTLIYGSWLPAPHLVHESGLQPFFEAVEADTGGAVDFEIFVGGAMGGPKEGLQSVRDMMVDSALIIDIYLKRELPASVAISNLFVIADDPLVFAAAANETYLTACPACAEEYERYQIKPLAYYATDTFHLMCTEPVLTLEDVQGVKVRASSRLGVWAQAMGATAVSVTTAEMYEAMQRGQADCTLGSLAWLNSYNLKDLVRSVIETPMGTFYSANVFNLHEETWAGLDDSERAAILRHLPALVRDIVFVYIEEGRSALADLKAAGGMVAPADQAMLDLLAAHRAGEAARVIEIAYDAGVVDPEGMLAVFLEKVDKWRGIVAEIDRDPELYEQALWREIYAKIE